MKIPDLLDGLALRLEAIDGLTVTTDPGATVVPPMVLVDDGDVTYDATMGRGSDDIVVNLTLYVSKADSAQGALEAREYKSGHGDKSLRTAIETSATGDGLGNVMIRQFTASTGVVERGGPDAQFIAVQVSLIATVSGTA